MVIVGLVALATVLVLYVADESNRIDATALQQRDDAIAEATTLFISNCIVCHGPAGLGAAGPDSKDANGNRTSRIGGVLGGPVEVLNHTGNDDKGTPWAGQVELGVTYPGGFAGRTAWITNRITNGRLAADGKSYIMPAFSEAKGGPLNDSQIEALVELIQYGDWNKVYNDAIATYGGYPTPGPGPASTTATAPAAAATTPAPSAGGGGAAAQAQLGMQDIAFDKKEFTIPADTDVTLTLTNTGATLHTFVVNDHNNPNVTNLGILVEVNPGEPKTVTINAPAGDYYYWCDIPGHEAAGMFGTMHVVAGAAAGASSPAAGSVSSPTGASAPAAASPAATTAPAGGATAALEMQDIAFDQKEFTIPANTDVTLTLTNAGATLHNFSVDDHNNPNVKNLGISVDVNPGETKTVTINAPAGDYYYYCNVPGHEAAGMFGTMHVT